MDAGIWALGLSIIPLIVALALGITANNRAKSAKTIAASVQKQWERKKQAQDNNRGYRGDRLPNSFNKKRSD